MESALTPLELEIELGESIKAIRLQKNLSRQSLCERAGISESALRHLEGGKGATLKTLIRVIRSLDRESWFASLSPTVTINPLHMVRAKRPRQRASKRKHEKKEKK